LYHQLHTAPYLSVYDCGIFNDNVQLHRLFLNLFPLHQLKELLVDVVILTSYLLIPYDVYACSESATRPGASGGFGWVSSSHTVQKRSLKLVYPQEASFAFARSQRRNLSIHEYLSANLLKTVSALPATEQCRG
jgi:hypothetical protein